MKNIDAIQHLRGESIYVDDIPERMDTLHALPILSSNAHARILSMDVSEIIAAKGVVAVFTARNIPGENQIGGILPDEPLFAEEEIHFRGQPLGMVIAKSVKEAQNARGKLILEVEDLEVITDPREAYQKGQLLFPSRTFESGDVKGKMKKCKYVFEGRTDTGGQEHLYIESQGSYVLPGEKDTLIIYSSTQGPTLVQKTVARVLGIPMYQIEVDVTRLGGAFGGKEDQATAWAVMAALGAYKLKKPVKLILDREDDMYATGKRHPYSSDFKIGLDEDYKINSFEVKYFQNGGAAADLSPAILERTLFHVSNAYHIPNVKATACSCRTNITPFTAFRGFGGPQAMFVIEAAIALAAEELGIDPTVIQERNLLKKGDEFHYGQKCKNNHAVESWNALVQQVVNAFTSDEDFAETKPPMKTASEVKDKNGADKDIAVHSFVDHALDFIAEIETFNQNNLFRKKGWAMMPICFGISFTNTSMNQARALVHIYQDGSVSVSTGAIEMGQGVNTKMTQVVATSLGISTGRIRLETTNTRRVANTSPTAASSGADLNGKATQLACQELMARLTKQAASILHAPEARISIRDEWVYVGEKKSSLNWDQLIVNTFLSRVQLSAVGHYATPEIHFNKGIEKGHPFAYHVFGSALIQVEINALLGSYEIEEVKIVHDFGNSFNMDIDLGQVEGALMQGIGWMTVEELAYAKNGRLLSDSLSKYKVPDIFMAPKKVEVQALQTEGEPLAILRSKAVGEPPFMYGIGAYFALAKAIRAFNPRYKNSFHAPMTPEKVLMGLYGGKF